MKQVKRLAALLLSAVRLLCAGCGREPVEEKGL